MKPSPHKKGRKLTYRERAEYLAEMFPTAREYFHSIATFFGPNEIPPKFTYRTLRKRHTLPHNKKHLPTKNK